jgi:heptosyltransferase-2
MNTKIVITPLTGLGDIILTTPAVKILKDRLPDSEITFFTFSTATHEILKNNPYIDNLWYNPIKVIYFIRDIFHILLHITFRFDVCINFYPSNREAYNIFSLLTGARNRIGHSYLHMNFSQLNWLKNKTIKEDFTAHCVEENVRLLKFLNISIPKEEIPPAQIYLTNAEEDVGKAFRRSLNKDIVIGVHSGNSTFKGHINRRWPKENFAQLIDLVPDAHFILFGALDELEINRFIQHSVKKPDKVSIVENHTIREVAAIIGQLDGFVSNDSGLMHIAAAMNVPTVAILGPTNRNYIYPWFTKHKIVRLDLPCSPCFYYSPLPLRCSQRNKYKCLRDLPATYVYQALYDLVLNKR